MNISFFKETFVTEGVYVDEQIVFDNVTPEWIDFCTHQLGYAVPDLENPQAIPHAKPDNAAPLS